MRIYSYLAGILSLLLFSCSHAQNTAKNEDSRTDEIDTSAGIIEFKDNRSATEKAMDAFNEIQVNGDGGIMLYLTFPNITHKECQGDIHSYDISAQEFRSALTQVMIQNNHKFSPSKRTQLATLGSQPWAYYTVITCGSMTDSSKVANDSLPPRQGTWIITEIFGMSDLLINW
jgi:hypothetical protein